jgi:hypothetical protein
MARLGELLIDLGLLTSEQVEQALRAQIIWGGRLGTNLVELGFVDLEELTRALARQHHIPAALARHFEHADPALQQKLPAELADQWSCVPLAAPAEPRRCIVATIGPMPAEGQAAIAAALGFPLEQLVLAIAAELRIRYYLELIYQIPRASRFLRPRRHTTDGFDLPAQPPDSDPDLRIPIDHSDFDELADDVSEETAIPTPDGDDRGDRGDDEDLPSIDDPAVEAMERTPVLDELDGGGLPGAESSGQERRHYLRSLAEDSAEPSAPTLGRIALRKRAVVPSTLVAEEPTVATTLAEATRAIRRSTDRDRVGDLVVDTARRFCPMIQSLLLLVLRHDVAVGWKGYAGVAAIPDLVLPLDEPSLARRALDTGMLAVGDAAHHSELDRRLVARLDPAAGALWIAPVMIGSRVVCLIAATTTAAAPVPTTLEAIASAAATAFARLMRAASR